MSGRSIHDTTLEEMRDLTGPKGPLAARWCGNCDKHYRFCGCAQPKWQLRSDGKLGPMPGERGGPRTLEEALISPPPQRTEP